MPVFVPCYPPTTSLWTWDLLSPDSVDHAVHPLLLYYTYIDVSPDFELEGVVLRT